MDPVLDWQVHDAKDYPTYTVEDDDHLSMGVSLYIPLDPNHRNDGEFRRAILGGDDEEVCVPAIDVYHTLLQAVANTMLHFAFSSIKTLIPRNCTSCPWQDATSLIRNVALFRTTCITRSSTSNHKKMQIRTDPDPYS
jgi:hypothetical protein